VTGHAGLADSALAMGAHGCVATYANVVPAVYSSIYRAARDGDWAAARAHQDYAVRAERLVNAWGPGSVFGSFLGATKTALREMGVLSSAVVGRPYPDPTESQVARVREAMASLGLSHVSPATLAK
jgi:4-hydroxy-tetrahydrodipicolinate synthase